MQICDQKSASGAIDWSDSHLTCGKINVFSDFNIILYILESSFLEVDILINSEIKGENSRLTVRMLIIDGIDDLICRYFKNYYSRCHISGPSLKMRPD